MKMHQCAILLSTFLLAAPLTILNCQAQNVATKNTTEPSIESGHFPISMGKPMTLAELASAFHDTAGATLDIEDAAYSQSFSRGTKIYVAGARSLPEFYDLVTQATGLKWRAGQHGEIVLYRDSLRDGVPAQPDISAVAKAN